MNFLKYDYYGNYNDGDDKINFSINEIHRNQKEREKRRLQIYDKILIRCLKKIKESSLKEVIYCFFEMPEYLPGLPLYNMTECLMYILNILKDRGFNARYVDPFLIYISWNLPKNMYKEFLKTIVVHEIFHLFIPGIYYKDGSENSCFVEGFVEFLTYKYNNKLSSIIKEYIEYNKIKNNNYKLHKFPYIFTPNYMYKLYIKNSNKIDNLINNMIYNFNNNYINYYKKYTEKDIIKYDKLFKKLFTKKCNNHIHHKLKK
jgi:hypothetical protein